MIPKAVHICYCISNAPRISGGVHSAAYIGTVADFGPMPSPKERREMNMDHQAFVNPFQKQASEENKQVIKIVPRLPNQLLKGMVSQQPKNAHEKYGAELQRPRSHVERGSSPPIPNWAP
jgi:hypothetical protein